MSASSSSRARTSSSAMSISGTVRFRKCDRGRSVEPANFLAAPAPGFFFQAAAAPDFFPKRLRLLLFFSSGSGSEGPKTPGSDRLRLLTIG